MRYLSVCWCSHEVRQTMLSKELAQNVHRCLVSRLSTYAWEHGNEVNAMKTENMWLFSSHILYLPTSYSSLQLGTSMAAPHVVSDSYCTSSCKVCSPSSLTCRQGWWPSTSVKCLQVPLPQKCWKWLKARKSFDDTSNPENDTAVLWCFPRAF